jgi:hypothetical protein
LQPAGVWSHLQASQASQAAAEGLRC